ncbi:unnamed protein product, partial [Brenthis ino]
MRHSKAGALGAEADQATGAGPVPVSAGHRETQDGCAGSTTQHTRARRPAASSRAPGEQMSRETKHCTSGFGGMIPCRARAELRTRHRRRTDSKLYIQFRALSIYAFRIGPLQCRSGAFVVRRTAGRLFSYKMHGAATARRPYRERSTAARQRRKPHVFSSVRS